MAEARKRQNRWSSKGFFRVLTGTKRPAAEANSLSDDTAVVSLDGCSTEDSRTSTATVARTRSNASKMLSFVGLHKDTSMSNPISYVDKQDSDSHTGQYMITAQASTPSDRDVALAIVKDAARDPVWTQASGCNQADLVSVESYKNSSLSSQTSLRVIPEVEVSTANRSGALDTNNVVPSSFAHHISHKLSEAFGNPTIVHRPKLRTRPSIISFTGDPRFIDVQGVQSAASSLLSSTKSLVREQNLGPQDDTEPSSYYHSGSVPAGDRSTGKTSLDSNVASGRSQGKVEEALRERSLTPIDETPTEQGTELSTPIPWSKPTITTVESTANAKIFFETHFNAVLSGQTSPRP